MLSTMGKARVRDSAQALAKWRAAVAKHSDPTSDGEVDTRMIRDLGEILELDDPVEEFTSDTLAAERVARLEVGATVLREQIAASLKGFKDGERGLQAAIEKAETEVERLRGIAADIAAYQSTLGFEVADAARARREAPRIFGQ